MLVFRGRRELALLDRGGSRLGEGLAVLVKLGLVMVLVDVMRRSRRRIVMTVVTMVLVVMTATGHDQS